MATITPTVLALSYKKYEPTPTPVQVEIDFYAGQRDTVLFKNVPVWLEIISVQNISETQKTALFGVNSVGANTSTPQDYSALIEVWVAEFAVLDSGYSGTPSLVPFWAPEPEDSYVLNQEYFSSSYDPVLYNFTKQSPDIEVNFSLEDSVLLSLSTLDISFDMSVGSTTPTGKTIQVYSERDWTVTKDATWISVTNLTGSNEGSFTVSINEIGLVTGTYSGTIIVSDGGENQTLNVTFTISDGNTDSNFLYVSPSEFEFVRNINSSFFKTSIISLNSSSSWSAVATETWIVLSATSGSSGSDSLTVTTNTDGLTPGVYGAEIRITQNDFIRKVYVTLHVYNLVTSAPDSDELYFSEENIELIMSTEKETSFLEVDFSAQTAESHVVYQKKSPFFNGKSTVNIGREAAVLIDSPELPSVLETGVVSFVSPAVISFTAYEKDYFAGNSYDSFERNNLSFLKGKTPELANRLCYMPEKISATPKGVLAFSIYSATIPENIYITGAVTHTIETNLTEASETYTAIINLNDFQLNPKDLIDLDFNGHVVSVQIKERDSESVILAFENEWQLPELIELTGELIIDSKANFKTHKTQTDVAVHEKIISATPGSTFSINSSWMYSQEEIDWLSYVFNTTRMYLYINSEQIEVIPTFTKMNKYKTDSFQQNTKFTFKKAIV